MSSNLVFWFSNLILLISPVLTIIFFRLRETKKYKYIFWMIQGLTLICSIIILLSTIGIIYKDSFCIQCWGIMRIILLFIASVSIVSTLLGLFYKTKNKQVLQFINMVVIDGCYVFLFLLPFFDNNPYN